MNNQEVKRLEEGKTISIKDLPDCWYKGRLTELVEDPSSKIVVVAKLGGIEDWSAYIGWPLLSELKKEYQSSENNKYYCENIHDIEGVKSYGDKLDKDIAEILFPEWKDKRYRR